MPDQAPGPTPAAETVTGQQPPAQQPQAPEGTQPPNQQPLQAQPSVEELQQQLQAVRESQARTEQSAKHWQSQFDRARQFIAGQTPAQVQPDPLDKYAQILVDDGYDPKDAKNVAKMVHAMVSPLQQQNQQLQASQQASFQVHSAFQKAVQENPGLFADPAAQQVAWNALNQAAQDGQGIYVNADYAVTVAAQDWSLRNKPWETNRPPVQAAPPRPPVSMAGWAGPGGNYQPMPQQQQGPQVKQAAMDYVKNMSAGYGPRTPTK